MSCSLLCFFQFLSYWPEILTVSIYNGLVYCQLKKLEKSGPEQEKLKTRVFRFIKIGMPALAKNYPFESISSLETSYYYKNLFLSVLNKNISVFHKKKFFTVHLLAIWSPFLSQPWVQKFFSLQIRNPRPQISEKWYFKKFSRLKLVQALY